MLDCDRPRTYQGHAPILRLPLVLVALLAGCGGNHPSAKSDSDWRAALGRMQQANAIFSFAYVAEPPAGSQFRLSLHEADAGDACSL